MKIYKKCIVFKDFYELDLLKDMLIDRYYKLGFRLDEYLSKDSYSSMIVYLENELKRLDKIINDLSDFLMKLEDNNSN